MKLLNYFVFLFVFLNLSAVHDCSAEDTRSKPYKVLAFTSQDSKFLDDDDSNRIDAEYCIIDTMFIGVAEAQNDRSAMEDCTVVCEVDGAVAVVLADGHGKKLRKSFRNPNLNKLDSQGYGVAHKACQLLSRGMAEKFLEGNPWTKEFVQKLFVDTDRAILKKKNFVHSGATASSVFVDNSDIIVSWIGDSRVVLQTVEDQIFCTSDHKPTCETETARIIESGSEVFENRVDGQLSVSRAFGNAVTRKKAYLANKNDSEYTVDLDAVDELTVLMQEKLNISAKPECMMFPRDSIKCIVVASDGLWDVMKNEEVVKFIEENRGTMEADAIAKELVRKAIKKKSTDNISVVVVLL